MLLSGSKRSALIRIEPPRTEVLPGTKRIKERSARTRERAKPARAFARLLSGKARLGAQAGAKRASRLFWLVGCSFSRLMGRSRTVEEDPSVRLGAFDSEMQLAWPGPIGSSALFQQRMRSVLKPIRQNLRRSKKTARQRSDTRSMPGLSRTSLLFGPAVRGADLAPHGGAALNPTADARGPARYRGAIRSDDGLPGTDKTWKLTTALRQGGTRACCCKYRAHDDQSFHEVLHILTGSYIALGTKDSRP